MTGKPEVDLAEIVCAAFFSQSVREETVNVCEDLVIGVGVGVGVGAATGVAATTVTLPITFQSENLSHWSMARAITE